MHNLVPVVFFVLPIFLLETFEVVEEGEHVGESMLVTLILLTGSDLALLKFFLLMPVHLRINIEAVN